MLIVAGVLEVDPDRRAEFLESRIERMRISRSEPGCLAYVFSADPLVDGRVVLYECWQDKQALAAHLSAQTQGAGAVPEPGVTILRSELRQYEIAAVGPLGS